MRASEALLLDIVSAARRMESYVAGMAFGFVANKLWAFGSKRRGIAAPADPVGSWSKRSVPRPAA